ncbi:MAG: NADH-quinone oxidoreductase subunit G, partial [Planctomycetaceae bacterium]
MAKIFIDNTMHEVADGQNLLQACLSLGYDVPYFCWHPAMHSVGACRQCAVKIFKDKDDAHGKIEMACMTPVRDGMRLSIDDPDAVEFRKTVIEWLMANHPHDCPVCDEGGECHLQDMTVMAGQTYRRFRFKKRTHENQNLGPFVTHEMNRCIQCYRCVRFYRDFAGGRDLEVLGWHDGVYFGRHADGTLESEFAGNLVEICPTGVFTDKTLASHYTRKWDLQTAPSVCVHCGLGCNTIPGERYGQLRRVHNRFNPEVNGYFLCDRGRYGYEFVNGERIRDVQISPLARDANENCNDVGATTRAASVSASGTPAGGNAKPKTATDLNHITSTAACRLAELVAAGAVGIGSPRASLEANYALRTLVGPYHFFSAVPQAQAELMSTIIDLMRTGPAKILSLRELESADAVFILGEDLTNVAPMADLAVRQTLRQKALKLADEVKVDRWNTYAVRDLMQQDFSPLFIATPAPTKLDEVSAGIFRGTPDDITALGLAVQRVADILSARV